MTNKKKKNYINIYDLKKYIYNSNNILLFIHCNNLNKFEINLFLSLLKSKDIKFFFIKLNLMKKFFNNKTILTLLNGPTYVFIFKEIIDILFIINNFYFFNKILPLAFIINKYIYNYKYIKLKYLLKNNIIKKNQDYINNFILLLNQSTYNLLNYIFLPILKLFFLIKKIKKINY